MTYVWERRKAVSVRDFILTYDLADRQEGTESLGYWMVKNVKTYVSGKTVEG